MSTPALFKEYIWLVNTIYNAQRLTFAQIQDKWLQTEMSGGVKLARSTFNRHKDAIQDIFDINIECDCRDCYKYYIEHDEDLAKDTVKTWMLSTLSVNDIILESKSLHNRILLQKIPCDAYLASIIDAMKKKVLVTLKYHKYNASEASCYDVEPYCLKLFNQRWYLMARLSAEVLANSNNNDPYRVYSFDRIKQVTLTDRKFEVSDDFDAQQFFAECFGVIVGDHTPAERIVLRAFELERNYLQDLPLHHSQKKIYEGDNYVDFEYYLRPTNDFCGHLLGLANRVKVIEPQSLADKLCGMMKDTLKMYE